MLRLLVVLLVFANLAFYAWTRGSLDGLVGVRALGDREPERLTRQVRPETIRVLPASAVVVSTVAAPAAETAAVALACLEAGPYTSAQVGGAEGVLQTVLPAGAWVDVKTETAGTWIVYMGQYPTREALLKKLEELRRLRIPAEELRNAPGGLEGGLALGRYDSRAAADKALLEVTQRGVRTARVAALTPPAVLHSLRVERADASVQSRLAGLRAEALLGRTFSACAPRP